MRDASGADDTYLDRPYELGGRHIDPIAGVVIHADRRTPLNRKLLEVLACLAEGGVEMVPRERFIERAWRGNVLVGETGLTHAVHSLRRALRDDDPDKPLIRTIPRRGYQLTVRAQLLDGNATVGFAPGTPIAGKPGWQLSRRLGGNAVSETWLVENMASGERRMFRFCRSERHLQALRRETKLLRYLRETLAGRRETAVVIDWQLEEPPYHLEMDYPSGGTLPEWVGSQGGPTRIPLVDRLRLGAEIAAALAAVHAAGVVHRNVSAASILIDEATPGRLPHALLGEFGLSDLIERTRLDAANITRAGLTLTGDEGDADARFLAPERLAGAPATAAGDVYALGVLLLQLASGDLARSPDAGLQNIDDPAGLREVLAECLDPDPDRRPTAAAVSDRLRAFAPTSLSGAPALAGPAPAPQPTAASPLEAEPAVGRTIGPYRLVDQLGEGGMGIVFLADQHAPVQRKVALKVVRTGLMSADVRARFEAERQALALMSHANVAAVYDAGSTPSGQPYFAMEYVQGQDITAHCDRLKLNVRERILLFLQVCDGVLHAHQKGLIHRDLKPGNILVSRAKDQPAAVKIIDFGVAKSVTGILAAQPAHTRLGSFVGTPTYSSPEQVSGPVASVDTRSDIYSLGVVLYELLAGVTPYNADELNSKTPVELARLLSGEQPPTPLARFSSLNPEQEQEIACRRAISVEQLKALLQTDLSWIVGKCLEIDPEDRYATVMALENDLRRWLDDKPVQARPASRLYRMRKFVRRHRLGVAAASLGTLVLLTTAGAAVYGYFRAEHALKEAEMATEFQVRQIQGLDPAKMGLGLRSSLRGAVKRRGLQRGWSEAEVARGQEQLDLLIEGMDFTPLAVEQLNEYSFRPALNAIEKDYRDLPLLQAQLWQTMADTMMKLGKHQEAVEPQRRALEQRRRLLGADHPIALRSSMRSATLKIELYRFDQAETESKAVYEQSLRALGEDDPITLEALSNLANVFYLQGKYDLSKKLQMRALTGSRDGLGEAHPLTLLSLRRLVGTLAELGESDEAIRYGEESLAIHRRVLGESLDTMEAMDSLAQAYWVARKPKKAEALVRGAAEGYRRLLGDTHSRTIGEISNLSLLLTASGQYSEAESHLRDAIRVVAPIQGRQSEQMTHLLRNLGETLTFQGRFSEAESIFRELLAGDRQVLGDEHPYTALDSNNLARVLVDQGRLDEAETLFAKALENRRRIFGEDHPAAIETAMRMANVLRLKGDLKGAEVLQRKAMTSARSKLGNADPLTLSVIAEGGAIARASGDLDRAEALLREALAGQRKGGGIEFSYGMGLTSDLLIDVLRERGAIEDAASIGDELIGAAPRIHPQTHFLIGRYMTNHARTLIELGRFEEAERLLGRARANLVQGTNPDPGPAKALAEAYVTLYERWSSTTPDAGLDRNVALWRGKREAANRAGAGQAAVVLSGMDRAGD